MRRKISMIFGGLGVVGLWFVFAHFTLDQTTDTNQQQEHVSSLQNTEISVEKRIPLIRKNKVSSENTEQVLTESEGFQDTAELSRKWMELLQIDDLAPSLYEVQLIAALRRRPSEVIYDDLYQLFSSALLSKEAKQLVISMLGAIATPESTRALYRLINDGYALGKDLTFVTTKAIKKLSTEQWNNEPNFDISAIMEDEWIYIKDVRVLVATAEAMARIGSRSSLSLFASELRSEGYRDSERITVIQHAMANIRNPELVPQLSEFLRNSDSVILQDSSAGVLANMATVESTEALLDWAANASYSDSENIRQWFDIAVSKSSLAIAVLEKRLPNQEFDSGIIREILEDTLIEALGGANPIISVEKP